MNPERAAMLAEGGASSPEPGQIYQDEAPSRLSKSVTSANSAPIKNNRWGGSKSVTTDAGSALPSRPRASAADLYDAPTNTSRARSSRGRSREADDWGTATAASKSISANQLPRAESDEDENFPWGTGARSFGTNLQQRLGPPAPQEFYSWGSETDPTSQPASPDAPPGFRLEDSPPIATRRNNASDLPTRPRSPPPRRQQSRPRSPRPRSPDFRPRSPPRRKSPAERRPTSPRIPSGPRSMPNRPEANDTGGWGVGTTSRPAASTSFAPYHAEDHAWGDAPAPEAGPSTSVVQNNAPADDGWGWGDVDAIAPVNASTAKRPAAAAAAASGGWGDVEDDLRVTKRSRNDSGYDTARQNRPPAKSRANSPQGRDEANHYRSPGTVRSRGRSRSRSPPPRHGRSKSRPRRSDSPPRRAPRSISRSPPPKRGRDQSRHRRRSLSASPPRRRRSKSRARPEKDDRHEDRGRSRRNREEDSRSIRGVSRAPRNKSLAPEDSQSQRGASVFPPPKSTYGGSHYSPSQYAPSRPGSPTAPSIFGSRQKIKIAPHPFQSCGQDDCTQCVLEALKRLAKVTAKPLSGQVSQQPMQPRSAPPTGPRGAQNLPTGPSHTTPTQNYRNSGAFGHQNGSYLPQQPQSAPPAARPTPRGKSIPPAPVTKPLNFGWGDEGNAEPRVASISNNVESQPSNDANPWGW